MQQPAPVAAIAATRVAGHQGKIRRTPPQRWGGVFVLAAAGVARVHLELLKRAAAMTRMLAALAVSGALASSGAAQTWEFELDNPVLTPANPSTTVKLSLDPGPGADYIAGVNFSVYASQGAWSDPMSLVPTSVAPPVSQNPGTISASSVLDISVGQLALFHSIPGRMDLWQATFTATDFPFTAIELRTETERFDVYLELFPPVRETRPVTEGRMEIIPAPGSTALLGFIAVGLAARRRRACEERSA